MWPILGSRTWTCRTMAPDDATKVAVRRRQRRGNVINMNPVNGRGAVADLLADSPPHGSTHDDFLSRPVDVPTASFEPLHPALWQVGERGSVHHQVGGLPGEGLPIDLRHDRGRRNLLAISQGRRGLDDPLLPILAPDPFAEATA